MRTKCTVMSLSGMPSDCAMTWRPSRGVCVADPHLELAVLVVRRAVLRLERRVGEERIVVRGFDGLRGALQRALRVAVVIELDRRRLLRQLQRALVEAVRCCWTPSDLRST